MTSVVVVVVVCEQLRGALADSDFVGFVFDALSVPAALCSCYIQSLSKKQIATVGDLRAVLGLLETNKIRMDYLSKFGVPPPLAAKVIKLYGLGEDSL